jgi:hypothetical protein
MTLQNIKWRIDQARLMIKLSERNSRQVRKPDGGSLLEELLDDCALHRTIRWEIGEVEAELDEMERKGEEIVKWMASYERLPENV